MLTTLAKLAQEGRWMEIRNREEEILTSLAGESAARAHMLLSKAWEQSAATPREYQEARKHALAMQKASIPGTFLHTWSLAIVATQSADLGYWKSTVQSVNAFMAELPSQPQAALGLPWVLFAAGRYHHYRRNYVRALACFDEAISANPTGELEERIRLFKVWTFALSGRTPAAVAALPQSVQHVSPSLLDAARSIALLSAGDWSGAEKTARCALRSADSWMMYDTVQKAELFWVLKTALQELRQFYNAAVWLIRAAALLSCWSDSLFYTVTSMMQGIGGESSYAASPRGCAHGSAGYRRCSLTSSVG